MSSAAPASSSPSKRREGGTWPEAKAFDFQSSPYGRGPPPPGPGSFYPGPSHTPQRYASHDYLTQEPPRGLGSGPNPHGPGYWGPPPPYEGYKPHSEPRMPPPQRVPRDPSRPYLAINEEQQSPHRRVPGSPPSSYLRGPPLLQPKREYERRPLRMAEGRPPEQVKVTKDKKTGDPL
jgi:hypothetical protein